MAETSAVTLRPISTAAAFSSRQNASSSVMDVRCPAMVSERFLGSAWPGSKETLASAGALAFRATCYSPGLIISSGFMRALKSSSEM